MAIGYDKPLYVLPFDHRGTFQKNMFGWTGTLTDEQTAQDRRHEVGDLRRASRRPSPTAFPEAKAGILVDEQFGADILRDAARRGYVTACPAEKSGQDEFDFEYGEDFARHIDTLPADLLQGPGALQPRGRYGDEPSPGGAAEAAVRLPARRRPQPVHVRAAGARDAGAARAVRRRQEGVRPGASARADGAGDH